MPNFDSFINTEEWISDYYLTSDEDKETFNGRVKAAVKGWKADEKAGGSSPLARFTARRQDLLTLFTTLGSAQRPNYQPLLDAFGYPAPAWHAFELADAPVSIFGSTDDGRSVVVLQAEELEVIEDLPQVKLLSAPTPDAPDGEAPPTVTADTVPATPWKGAHEAIGSLFLADPAPSFIVLLAGNWVVLAERASWQLGRYLAINVGLVVERNNTKSAGEVQRTITALACEHVARDAEERCWWTDTLQEASNHSVEVSAELRQAVRRSIEIIGNDVLNRRKKHELSIEDVDGAELGTQALRFLYRILFLLFAEASPELHILPTGDPDYDAGYGLARLRDRIIRDPVTPGEKEGTHLYESLQLLFRLVNEGHDPDGTHPSGDAQGQPGLRFRELEADLFSRAQTSYIDEVKLSNQALTTVLRNLLLTEEKKGSDRGFISYASLGVAQLGQVYEGLMSYKGFIATETLVEVAKKGKTDKGSWVVPKALAETLPGDSIVKEYVEEAGNLKQKTRTFAPGSFVFRQSSRDRERSASFYTPGVLTEFTVGQAIDELEDSGRISCADDILDLTVCEPALGSGAFAVEAVNQLAEKYLTLKEEELGLRLPAQDRATELQKVKAHIALHQVYGVDLNKTAVELAEISLWLNTMTAELKAPWFGLRLRQGNSLIGATRSTFTTEALSSKKYLEEAPTHHPVEGLAAAVNTDSTDASVQGRVFHFLVPSMGWGSAAGAKDAKELAGEEIAAMKKWRKSIQQPLTKKQIKKLVKLSARAERLWEISLQRLWLAESEARRELGIFGQEQTGASATVVKRAEIEEYLFGDPKSAFQRLRLVMDIWNALCFWPLTKADQLPEIDELLDVYTEILGQGERSEREPDKQEAFDSAAGNSEWNAIDFIEDMEREESQQRPIEDILAHHPWLQVARDVASEQAFFHWELDFATVMARGGFDLQVGNPPWVRPRTDVDALYAEHDPWFRLATKPTQAAKKARRASLAENPAVVDTLTRGLAESVVTAAVLRDLTRFAHSAGQAPDLYRGFMDQTWAHAHPEGVVSLIHPESHLTEKKAARLRAGAYRRLRRHWQFINELSLFDVHHLVQYGVHVYGGRREEPSFLSASSLYHPQTVLDSLRHDGAGPLPGSKDDTFKWDLRPHRSRIVVVDSKVLEIWSSIMEQQDKPLIEARFVYTITNKALEVLRRLARSPRIGELGLQSSEGWNETSGKKKGYFDTSWQVPSSWSHVILQGPHLGVATPMIKQPNESMENNLDWSAVDAEAMPEDFIPATAYYPTAAIDGSSGEASLPVPDALTETYRVAWRRMGAMTGVRTMYPSLIPRHAAHINGIQSAGPINSLERVASGAVASSLLADFFIRSVGISNLYGESYAGLPRLRGKIADRAAEIYLQLNCLTRAYAELWEQCMGTEWTKETPLRIARDRWHAQNRIDVLAALGLGVSIDDLIEVYKTQFPVLRKYDRDDLYDANGRKLPRDMAKLVREAGDKEISEAERTWQHPQSKAWYVYEYPIAPLDREADLRQLYREEEERLRAGEQ